MYMAGKACNAARPVLISTLKLILSLNQPISFSSGHPYILMANHTQADSLATVINSLAIVITSRKEGLTNTT
jgi:hypothetical protein